MRVELMFPSEYLSAADLMLLPGQQYTATIEAIRQEMLRTNKGGKEARWVVTLKKARKRWVLNKTNATTIAKLYGPEANNWADKRVTLYVTKVDAFGETKDAIRVRPEKPPEPVVKQKEPAAVETPAEPVFEDDDGDAIESDSPPFGSESNAGSDEAEAAMVPAGQAV